MARPGTDALLISLQMDLDTIGLKQLHHVLLARGFRSILLYLPGFSQSNKTLLDRITSFVAAHGPRFIGISLMSHEYENAVALTRHLKRTTTSVPVVWGGIHPTIAPETCLDHADYICVGEGESTVVSLAEALRQGQDIEHIHNLRYRRAGRIIENPVSPLIEDLDPLPICEHLPRSSFIGDRNRIMPLNKQRFKRYARWQGTVYSIIGSRGCPFSCSYCCNNALSRLYGSRSIRRRSIAGIIRELSRAVADNPQIEFINFQDDCFLACSDAYLEEFCSVYRKSVDRPFIVRCIPSFISVERLKLLKTAGLTWISLGLQSGSDRVLTEIYNRRSNADDFLKAARMVNHFKIGAYYDVILDNPLEEDLDRLETIRVITSIPRPYFLQLFSLTLYPGTALRERIIADFPALADTYVTKNYHRYRHSPLNRLIRMSAYLPPLFIRKLAADYENSRRQTRFRLLLMFSSLLSALIMEPLACLKVIRISRGGSMSAALQQLPSFLRVGLSRYVKQFPGRPASLIESVIRDNITRSKLNKRFESKGRRW